VLQTFRNAWKLPELRGKILFTLFILLIYRLGSTLPVPYIDSDMMKQIVDANGAALGYLSIMAGDAFSKANVFALSISPYITSQIVMQLLTIAIPALERLAAQGEEGRKKINRITRYVTVALAIVTAYGYYTYLRASDVLTKTGFFEGFIIVSCYAAGASLIMWLAEKINDKGIGNGISIILFANIVSSLPLIVVREFMSLGDKIMTGNTGAFITELLIFAVVLVIALAIIYFVVHMHSAERRIPVQYAKRQVGRRMYGGQNTYLPLKLNMTGVMPIIFASSIVALPSTIGMMCGVSGSPTGGFWQKFIYFFSPANPLYALLTFILIIAFAYFYISISFSPVEVSNNLQKNGGSILGIRPGKPTADYIAKILKRITLIGAIFLGIIAAIPQLATAIMQVSTQTQAVSFLTFGGSSIIILVGVVIEVAGEIENQMTMRHYKGFLE